MFQICVMFRKIQYSMWGHFDHVAAWQFLHASTVYVLICCKLILKDRKWNDDIPVATWMFIGWVGPTTRRVKSSTWGHPSPLFRMSRYIETKKRYLPEMAERCWKNRGFPVHILKKPARSVTHSPVAGFHLQVWPAVKCRYDTLRRGRTFVWTTSCQLRPPGSRGSSGFGWVNSGRYDQLWAVWAQMIGVGRSHEFSKGLFAAMDIDEVNQGSCESCWHSTHFVSKPHFLYREIRI